MCGIAAVWGGSTDDHDRVFGMLGRIAHRGPDAEGIRRSPNGAGVLGHRRLSIIDVRGGNQPIRGARERSAIVANGEIYNYRDLRAGMTAHRFRTRSDSETALARYERDGERFVHDLDGMYALLIEDGEDLVAARDPIGIKPLYLARRDDAICFASEVKSLVGLGSAIEEVPPGTLFHTRRGFRRFYEAPQPAREYLSEDEARDRVRRVLERAVTKRLVSDVPVGAFLSGGLDSSVVAAIARRHVDELHTFAVGIEGSEDLQAARLVARHIDSVHHEYVFEPEEIRRLLPSMLYHLESFDQDLVRSAVPTYLVARLASQHVKVVLTGEGADELFAGYTYHRSIADPAVLQRELRRSIAALHSMNLQRADRMTMAHGLEARVPFLDTELVALSMQIAPEMKLRRGPDGRLTEKWILRQAVADLLPPEIVWRVKAQFDEGSGSNRLLEREAGTWLTTEEARRYREQHPDAALRSDEEAVYHHLLCSVVADPGPLLATVARWTDRPDWVA